MGIFRFKLQKGQGKEVGQGATKIDQLRAYTIAAS